jgi:RNA polymerase sigma factor (sigma-70 family)
MAVSPDHLITYIRRVLLRPQPEEASDAALLRRFIAARDERAFARLVERHGPLVLRVCRRVLGNVQDAEDAFQAAFLVLARKADAVRPPEALTAWLHGVAYRVALKARSTRVRQLRRRQPLLTPPADPRSDPLTELSARELLAVVDEEVRGLPEVYRLPVILCCLEGHSVEEAARQLGWTRGSVRGRLARGRARLRKRLMKRGLTLSAVLAAAELSRGLASAGGLGTLVARTVPGAAAFGMRQSVVEGISAGAMSLTRQVLGSMALARLKLTATFLLATCLLALGLVIHGAGPSPSTAAAQAPTPAGHPEDQTAPAARAPSAHNHLDDPIEVNGQVLDTRGQPFAGAKLYVGYAQRRTEPEAIAHRPAYPLRATSDADGRFRFTFTRSELDERYLDAARPVVMAVADGFGPDWADVVEPTSTALSLRLVEDAAVEGQILNQDRQPLGGATILVRGVSADPVAGLARFFEAADRSSPSFKSCLGPLPGQASVTTDADGRFRLTGVGRDRYVTLALAGEMAAPSPDHVVPPMLLGVATSPTAVLPPARGIQSPGFTFTVPPARSIRGVVRDKATGQPVAGVKMSVETTGLTTFTDGEGGYELRGWAGSGGCVVVAQPESGQRYFAASVSLAEKAKADLTADFALVGGIPLRGRVTDQATGKPPKRGVVEYYPLFPNAYSSELTNCARMLPASAASLQPDGSYSLMALPGPGVVLVAVSPRDSYASALLDDTELAHFFNDGRNHGGGSWIYIAVGGRPWERCVDRYNALALIKPDEKAVSVTLDLTVRPAPGLKGTVVGPDGRPLTGVRVIGLTSMPDAETLTSASFTVEGLNPRRPRELCWHHKEAALGKAITIRGDETEPLTVQLEPCPTLSGRLVDRAGHPVARVTVHLARNANPVDISAETDGDGRFRVGLVPGLKYSLVLPRGFRLLQGAVHVQVESGRSQDLGDLPLDELNPRPGGPG